MYATRGDTVSRRNYFDLPMSTRQTSGGIVPETQAHQDFLSPQLTCRVGPTASPTQGKKYKTQQNLHHHFHLVSEGGEDRIV